MQRRSACRNFIHRRALVRRWIAKHGAKRGDEWHLQASQQLKDMCAGGATEDSLLVLEADQIDIAEIQKVRGLAVGSQVLFGQLEPHPDGIVVAIVGVVHQECH